ncbi:hypothetical protein EV401DRAFT_1965109, partial [Pisolithus croceorrhizus]
MYSRVFILFLTAAVAVALVYHRFGSCTCGSDYYTPIDIYNAISQAVSGGGGDYPHQYDDYEATRVSPSPHAVANSSSILWSKGMFIPEVRLEQTVSFTTPRETFAHALLTRARLSMMDLSSAARSTNPLTHRMYYMQTG